MVGNGTFSTCAASMSTMTMSCPASARSWATARPTRPQPQTTVCPLRLPICLSMRRLPNKSRSWPSTTSCTDRVKAYNTVPTPVMMRTIANHFSAVPNGWTSSNPTVVTVVTVW